MTPFTQLKQSIQPYELIYNSEEYFICQGDTTIQIEQDFYTILHAIQNHDTEQDTLSALQNHYDDLDAESFREICNTISQKIQTAIDEKPHKYTSLNIPLMNIDLTKKIYKCLSFLFAPKVFFTGIAILICINILVLYNIPLLSLYTMGVQVSPYYLIIMVGLSLVHELGHVIASSRVSDKKTGVFFGFYGFIPVFYTDVSHIWTGTKIQRIIVTLGGYGLQILVSTGILVYGYQYGNTSYIGIGILSFLSAVYGIAVPFGRSDGYWLIVDVTGIKNMLPNFYKALFTWNFKKLKKLNFVYGILHIGFMIYFLYLSINIALNYQIPDKDTWINNILSGNIRFGIQEVMILGLAYFIISMSLMLGKFIIKKVHKQYTPKQG